MKNQINNQLNNAFWFETDIIKLLELQKHLTPFEIDDITTRLSSEIWYRILNEELVKLVPQKDYQDLKTKFASEKDLNTIINFIVKSYPQIKITQILLDITSKVKKEFVTNFQKANSNLRG